MYTSFNTGRKEKRTNHYVNLNTLELTESMKLLTLFCFSLLYFYYAFEPTNKTSHILLFFIYEFYNWTTDFSFVKGKYNHKTHHTMRSTSQLIILS